ncbi:MAG: PD40 domain-containing protein [Anaerolineae bacterium]|nr:PD40 domain-containing protein [Anaerolineae bacterium]
MRLISKLVIVLLGVTLAAGALVLGYLAWMTLFPPAAPPPRIEFNSVEVGDIVTVSVTTRGERVTRAELWTGDQMVAREVNPNPAMSNPWEVAWQWQPPGAGVFPLAARAYDERGRYGASSLFSVVIPPEAKLLFASNREGGHALYEIEAATRATGLWQPPLSQNRQPAVGSKERVAFVTNEGSAWRLAERTLEDPTIKVLTPNLTTVQRPAFSADGSKIAFEVTGENGATNLVLSDANGENQKPLTDTDGYNGQASFNPAGDVIAFTMRQGNLSDIYTVALGAEDYGLLQLTRLTTDAAQEAQPAWSPDGARIAYVSNRSGISQVWVMNADGSNAVQLTNIPAGAEQPKWSPDGNWLAFVTYTGSGEGNDRRELYLLYAPASAVKEEQRGVIRLTQNDSDDTEPAWVR